MANLEGIGGGAGHTEKCKRKCFLCASPDVVVDGTNSLGNRSEALLLEGHYGGGPGPSSDTSYWSTFVLTKLFKLAKEECEELLEIGRVEGNSWIQMCGSCVQFVQQFRKHDEEKLEIEMKMEGMRKEAREKLLGLHLDGAHNIRANDNDKGAPGPSASLTSLRERIKIYEYFLGVYSGNGSDTAADGFDEERSEIDLGHKRMADMVPPEDAGTSKTAVASEQQAPSDEHLSQAKEAGWKGEKDKRRNPMEESVGIDLPVNHSSGIQSATTLAENWVDDDDTNGSSVGVEMDLSRMADMVSSDGAVAFKTEVDSDSSERLVSSEETQSQEKVQGRKESEGKGNKTKRMNYLEDSLECVFCERTFASVGTLNSHIRRHIGETPVHPASLEDRRSVSRLENPGGKPSSSARCSKCRKSFSSKSSLSQHLTVHTGVKAFVCEICRKGFSQKGNLKRHMRTHTNEKAFACNLCDKRFSESWHLARHMLCHTKEKANVCLFCAKGFSQISHLKIHLRGHTFERPHFCKECGKEFSHSSSLVQHIRIHSNDRPYKCEICGKGFKHSSSLTVHYRVHTTEWPFICKHCKQGFSNGSGLVRHGKRKNPCY